jgi:hypothetical protein
MTVAIATGRELSRGISWTARRVSLPVVSSQSSVFDFCRSGLRVPSRAQTEATLSLNGR